MPTSPSSSSGPSPHAPAFVPAGLNPPVATPLLPSSSTTPRAPKDALNDVPCRYFRAGYCFRGPNCWFKHDTPGRTVTAVADEPVTPEDEVCGICLDKVVSEYGLMTDCDHVFCLSCIRTWRDTHKPASADRSDYDAELASTSKTCPMCRKRSRFIIPSLVFPYPPADGSANVLKKNIETAYLRKLASIPCKHFVEGLREIEEAAAASARGGEGNGGQAKSTLASATSSVDLDSPSTTGSTSTAVTRTISSDDQTPQSSSSSTPATGTGTTSPGGSLIGPHSRRRKLPLCPFGNQCHYKHELVPGKKFVYTDAELSRARRAASAQRRNRERIRSAIGYMNRMYGMDDIGRPRHFPRWVITTLARQGINFGGVGLLGPGGLEWISGSTEQWGLSDEEQDDEGLYDIDDIYYDDNDDMDDEEDDSDHEDEDDNESIPPLEPADIIGRLAGSGTDGRTTPGRRRGPHRRYQLDPWESTGLDDAQVAYLRTEQERIREELPDLPPEMLFEHLRAMMERGVDW